jgi:hypothetical protein
MTVNNPPAFPLPTEDVGNGHVCRQEGMSLRDYFAAQYINSDKLRYLDNIERAVAAYELADALLLVRERKLKDQGSQN